MKRLFSIISVSLMAAALAGCMHMADPGWVTLIDGKRGLENFDRIGDANWRGQHDYIVADSGKEGYLVSKKSYKDFVLRVEFWADDTTNSGVHVRCSDPKKITNANCYEMNIYDQAPNPRNATGAIVNIAGVNPSSYRAAGRWNVYEIYARGPEITVMLNGVITAVANNSQLKEGPLAFQYGPGPKGVRGGTIRWRKVEIKEL